MIVEEQHRVSSRSLRLRKLWPWVNGAVTILLAGFGIWYLTRKVSLAAIGNAIAMANLGYVLLSLFFILAIVLLKAWRWRLILAPEQRDLPLRSLFWSTMLGHYVNLIVPFLRLGEVARIYALNRQTGANNIRTLGTLVVEKALDMIMLLLTLGLLLPIVALPNFISEPGFALTIITVIFFSVLYLLAFQTDRVIMVSRNLTRRLPDPVTNRLMQMIISGLEGLAALRNQRVTLTLLVTSAILAMMAILPPYLLLLAFDIPLGFIEATLINIVITVALTPPSTPAKIGVFDGTVAFMLARFGLADQAVIASYTIVFHLVAVLPLIILGSVAASRTNWHRKRSIEEK